MFILANRNIILPSKGGETTMTVKRGFIGDIPAHFCETAYFDALVRDGKITLSASRKDKDIEQAAEQSEGARKSAAKRAKATAEKSAE